MFFPFGADNHSNMFSEVGHNHGFRPCTLLMDTGVITRLNVLLHSKNGTLICIIAC